MSITPKILDIIGLLNQIVNMSIFHFVLRANLKLWENLIVNKKIKKII